ncbi:site-specific DNA-methyltransferase [Lonepinella sp. MS14435]|uniref:site-specific DNA-methyltransferase n=1 Tax=Lonepinella sp. MS14435 TaxID=3003618 RepID=UPI0036DAAC50
MLNWAGKSEAYQTLQTPSLKTLTPCPQESVDFDHSDNIFIEGENLDVLKILQKSYFNSVKMIYIDPPYNTGNDFVYHDNFASRLDDYQQQSGEKDENGLLKKAFVRNSKENGHYHSNWLNMMLPRLHLAKNLLKDDGVIFISIDDNEQAQLKLLCDEVFGEENFVEKFSWVKTSTPPSLSTKSRKTNEFIFCYEKNRNPTKYNGENLSGGDQPLLNSGNSQRELIFPKEIVRFNSDKFPNGKYSPYLLDKVELLDEIYIENGFSDRDFRLKGEFKWTQDFLNNEIKNGTTFIIKTEQLSIRFIRDESGYKRPTNFIKEKYITPVIDKKEQGVGTNESASSELEKLLGAEVFDYPKPISLLKYLINFVVTDNDLVLDFFAGSATTAHAVMQLNSEDNGNRHFICVQLPEELKIENATSAKAKKIIETAIKFCRENNLPTNIAEISKERIRRAGKQIAENNPDNPLDTGFKVFKLTDSHFKQWQSPNMENLAQQLEFFIDPVADFAEPQAMLYEILLRLGLKLSVKVRSENHVFWLEDENGKRYAILLSEANEALFNQIIEQQPLKVVMLDRLFNGNDALKKNTELQFADHHIQFLVI